MPSRKDSPHKIVPQWRRFLIAAGTARYARLPKDAQLCSVSRDLKAIRHLFCDAMGYKNALPDLKINPKKDAFRQTLRDWIRNSDRNESDVVVIYYSGHGDIEEDRHYLLTADSDPEDLLDTAVPTEDLARRIASSSVRLVLLLIDTCYAGSGSGDIAKVVSEISGLFSRENVGFFVIAAARPKEEARQGAFVEALTNVFYDERLAGERQEFLLPISVSTAINRYFRNKNLSQLTMIHESYSGYEDPPFFPNPRYRPSIPIGVDLKTQKRLSSIEPADILLHWGPRGRGVEIESQAGWYFTGRTRILSELVRWLEKPPADAMPQVITGGPGVGKSAVLARLVTMADPECRRQAPLEGVDPETIPPESCIDVAIHAKGKTPAEIVRAISRATGAVTEDADELVRDFAGRLEPITIVIDALDEAREPEVIADKVLRPMTLLPAIRLLIATRKGLVSNLGTHVEIKYLDTEYYEPEDIRDYVKLRLLARDEPDLVTPYRDKADLAGKVAEVVAGNAKTVFLIARLICENLIQAKETVDPQSDEWRNRLPDTVASAFGDYLKRFGVEEYRVRDLLLPLAYAEGEGLPWDNLWAPLASALSGRAYTDDDVAWVRDKAGAYIVEALQSGRSVYRLYHQALADYFHDAGLDEKRHRTIAKALIASVPEKGAESSKMWQEGHLYVLQHLSTHAGRGGMLSGLMLDPLYLLLADPVRLLAAIDRSNSTLPAESIRVYKQTVHRLHDLPLEEKASYLELSARKHGVFNMAEQIASLPLARRWVPRWARWAYSHTHTVFEGHTSYVHSIALGQLGGREVVVSGGEDDTVRVWEASTGKTLQVLKGHRRYVKSVVLGQLGGCEVVVSAGWDTTVRIWEPSTGKVLRVLKGHISHVNSVALGQLGGREVVVSAGEDRTVRVWETCAGETVQVIRKHTGPVNCVALGHLGGREIVVSGSEDSTVIVWEASTGKTLQVLQNHRGYVKSIALGQLGGREVVVFGGEGRTVQVCEISGGKNVQVLNGHEGNVRSVALGWLSGREVVVSGSEDNTVQIWEASTGEALQVLQGHIGQVNSTVLGQLGGRDVVVSGSMDRTVRVWEAFTDEALQRPKGPIYAVHSVVSGRLGGRKVVVSGGSETTIRVWDASTGEILQALKDREGDVKSGALGATREVLQPRKGYEGNVRSVALERRLNFPELVVSGGEDRAIRVWEASTGNVLHVLRGHSGYVRSVALGELGGREIVVSGSDDETVRVWDASTGRALAVLDGHTKSVIFAAPAHLGGRDVVVCGSEDNTVRIFPCDRKRLFPSDRKRFPWPTKAPKVLRVGERFNGGVTSVTIGRLGGREVVAVGTTKGTVRVYELARRRFLWRGKALHVLDSHTPYVRSVALGRLGDREVVVCSAGETVQVWELEPDNIWTSIFMEASVLSIVLDGTDIVVGTSAGIAVLGLGEGRKR